MARTLLKIRKRLDAYLSACQLGITLASLGLGWVGEPAFSRLVAPLLHQFGVQSPEAIHNTSVAIAFDVISFLQLVFGAPAPKPITNRPTATRPCVQCSHIRWGAEWDIGWKVSLYLE